MITPQHGREFIFDFYAILGIGPKAERHEIAVAFRNLQKQYHPDLYIGLAEEAKLQAVHKSGVLSLAYETLVHPAKRAEYDQLLESWDGPISRDGVPILDLRRSSMSGLLQFDEGNWRALVDKIDVLSGYDADTLELLTEQYEATDSPKPQLVKAYLKALHSKLAKLTVEEGSLLQVLGADADLSLASSTQHVQNVRQAIAERKDQVQELAAGGDVFMLDTGEIVVAAESAEDLTTKALAIYEDVGQRVVQTSQAREDAINQLLSIRELRRYQPAQEQIFANVFVGLDFGEAQYWFLYRIQDDEANVDELSFHQEEMQQLLDPQYAQKMIGQGYNILLVQQQEGIDFMDQISAAVQWHCERLNS